VRSVVLAPLATVQPRVDPPGRKTITKWWSRGGQGEGEEKPEESLDKTLRRFWISWGSGGGLRRRRRRRRREKEEGEEDAGSLSWRGGGV